MATTVSTSHNFHNQLFSSIFKNFHFSGGHGHGFLQTITDDLEEEDYHDQEGRRVKMVDKPEMISPDLPPGYNA